MALLGAAFAAVSTAAPDSLFSQSAELSLARQFPSSDISFLLLDANTGAVLASRWDDPSRPIPLGSLVKPFTALAYASQHAFVYPEFVCNGKAGGCWQPQPHGKLGVTPALAVSCNAYFRAMAAQLTGEQVRPIAQAFQFDPPAANLTGPPLMGIGEEWKIAPLRMARAYLELSRRRDQPGVQELIAGMKQAARSGTAAAVDSELRRTDALAKTGTAPCTHHPHAAADGFVLALAPAAHPEILLLVRIHGVTGAKAAEISGQMLHHLED